jgi:hypothetical protein
MQMTPTKAKPLSTERRPIKPAAFPPRSGPSKPHQVKDGETWESVARQYNMPVDRLIAWNFNTRDPGEINWYLREYVGCTLPTADGKNWRFSSSASPGKIYIPQTLVMDEIPITGDPGQDPKQSTPQDPKQPQPFDFSLGGEKFSHEFKGPKRVINYVVVQVRFAIEGEYKYKSGNIKAAYKSKTAKASVEAKINENVTVAFGIKIDQDKNMDALIQAIKSRSIEDFAKALFMGFESSIKKSFKFGKFTVSPRIGMEVSDMPFVFRVSGDIEDDFPLDGAIYRGKFAVEAGFNIGPSPKGWAWLAEKVGRPVLRRFLAQLASRLGTAAEVLLSEAGLTAGIVAAGTIIGTIAISGLCAYAVKHASEKGELRGVAAYYVSAYIHTAMHPEDPNPYRPGNVLSRADLRDELVALGIKDALEDGRRLLRSINHPAASAGDRAVREAYCNLLVEAHDGSFTNAKIAMKNALEDKARRLVGL